MIERENIEKWVAKWVANLKHPQRPAYVGFPDLGIAYVRMAGFTTDVTGIKDEWEEVIWR